MDTSHHKLTWEAYTTYSLSTMEDDPPFDPSQWPYYLPTPQPHPHPHPLHTSSNSSPPHLLPPQTFLPDDDDDGPDEELGAMKEMMFKIAAMQPVDIDPATIRRPRRRNVRISDDPQSVAARHRRERISEKIRILQRLVPGGTKMDTASMLDEAIRYVKFLKRQIRTLQGNGNNQPPIPTADDWAKAGTSYLFGGNSNDGTAGDDFNHKFIRDNN